MYIHAHPKHILQRHFAKPGKDLPLPHVHLLCLSHRIVNIDPTFPTAVICACFQLSVLGQDRPRHVPVPRPCRPPTSDDASRSTAHCLRWTFVEVRHSVLRLRWTCRADVRTLIYPKCACKVSMTISFSTLNLPATQSRYGEVILKSDVVRLETSAVWHSSETRILTTAHLTVSHQSTVRANSIFRGSHEAFGVQITQYPKTIRYKYM